MSENKQIEEMAKDILKFGCVGTCLECEYATLAEDDCACVDVKIAEGLYNAGYRQIPEGAIVLTRAEIDALTQYNEKVKRQYAREIFAELGKLTCTNEEDYRIFAELKKKYTGEDINVPTTTEEGNDTLRNSD